MDIQKAVTDLEKSLKDLNLDVKNKRQIKANLEKDIEALKKASEPLAKKVRNLQGTINEAVDEAYKEKNEEIANLQEKLKTEIARVAEARIEVEDQARNYKNQSKDAEKAKKNANETVGKLDAERLDINQLKEKLIKVYDCIKSII